VHKELTGALADTGGAGFHDSQHGGVDLVATCDPQEVWLRYEARRSNDNLRRKTSNRGVEELEALSGPPQSEGTNMAKRY
jgi:hypothetical protein